jgi:Asp-tRNA(Asn)/Glu-tRNA(Gln) amidotransferase A subunit family amidase
MMSESGLTQHVLEMAALSGVTVPAEDLPAAVAVPLPLGAQIIAAPWREGLVLRTAIAGEALGLFAAALVSPMA